MDQGMVTIFRAALQMAFERDPCIETALKALFVALAEKGVTIPDLERMIALAQREDA